MKNMKNQLNLDGKKKKKKAMKQKEKGCFFLPTAKKMRQDMKETTAFWNKPFLMMLTVT